MLRRAPGMINTVYYPNYNSIRNIHNNKNKNDRVMIIMINLMFLFILI